MTLIAGLFTLFSTALMAIFMPKMLFDCIVVGCLIWLGWQLYKLQEEHDNKGGE